MKILLLGSNGQLGKELVRQLPTVGDVVAFPRVSLDITDHTAIKDSICCIQPDIIVNAAAYTAVDQAEKNYDAAFAINAEAVDNLAQMAKKIGALLIHYSTDYVFDGTKPIPYLELDSTNPINVYGASKLAGELAISDVSCQHLIFRTTWVIGKDGCNFVKTILRLASEHDEINVVSDQLGVPTSSSLISKVTIDAIQAFKVHRAWPNGIYHLSPRGKSNWHEVAQTLVGFAERQQMVLNASVKDIKAIATTEYPKAAQRPLNSQLDTQKLHKQLSFTLPYWKDEFLDVVKDIVKELQLA